MGKDLRGRELGEGLQQLNDGSYRARFTNKQGKRTGKRFVSLKEAKAWLIKEKAKMMDLPEEDGVKLRSDQITVDQWFETFIESIKRDRSWNTIRNYRERYEINVKPIIGQLLVIEVRPLDCLKIFNTMEDLGYAHSTIRQAYICVGTLFKSAKANHLISTHPLDGVDYKKKYARRDTYKCLTPEEEISFRDAIKNTMNDRVFRFALETGLRTGEIVGLTWDSVSFDKKTVLVNKQLEYRYSRGSWIASPPKTISGYREVPLTDEAYQILQELYAAKPFRKEHETINTVLSYYDILERCQKSFSMKEVVFLNARTGLPTKNSTYDTFLRRMCEKAKIRYFSMHSLRHTFASRMIEMGVAPSSLQRILGHSSIKTTMDRYVHVSDDTLQDTIKKFDENRKAAKRKGGRK